MESGLRTLSPRGLDPSPTPSLPDILAHTATCELEQEKTRFMAGAGATGGTGTRGEPGHRFLNPQDSAAAVLAVKCRTGSAPDPPQDLPRSIRD